MTDRDLQDSIVGPVIDWQGLPYPGNIDIAHNTVIGNIQNVIVFLNLLVCHRPFHTGPGQFAVIVIRLREQPVIVLRLQLRYRSRIGSYRSGLVKAVPPVRYSGITDQTNPYKYDQA